MAKPSDMMNLTEIIAATGFKRGKLQRLLEFTEIREWLGGLETHPLYPTDQLDRMRFMFEQSEEGVEPRPFAIGITNDLSGIAYAPSGRSPALQDDQPGALATIGDTSILPSAAAIGDAGVVFGERFGATVIELLQASRILPAPEDRFLTREEAAKLLACKPSAVGRRVAPVLPETWSFLMIQEYMAVAVAKAREKAAAKTRTVPQA